MKCHHSVRNMLAILCAFTVSSIAVAQEAPPSQYEHVKGLEPFIGFWAGDAPDGEEGGIAVMCRWAANKSYGQFNVWTRGGDERMHLGMINVGWDHAEKKLAMWAFFPDTQAKAYPSIDGGTIKWSSTGTSADGEKTSADVKFQVDDDTLTIEVRNSRRGDADQPDMTLSLKRRERGER